MPCNPNNSWTSSLSPSLLRRLAEAADGFRNKHHRYYLVARIQGDLHGNHEIRGPFQKTQDLPDDLCAGIGNTHGWFGPFEAEGPRPNALLVHEMDIRLNKPDNTPGRPLPNFPAHRFDLLVWSRSALEKFLVPYYARMYGGAYVDRLLRDFDAEPLQMVGHLPGTEYEQIDEPSVTPGGSREPEPLQPGLAALIKLHERKNTFEVEVLLPDGGSRVL